MRYFEATLAENEVLAPHTFVLHLDGCAALAPMRPGQFIMLRGEWGRDPMLPRAFSVLGVADGRCEVLVKTHGRGTALLEAARPGQRFSLLGPLGTSFPAPSADSRQWLVAGGVGLAPLLFHAERAAAAGFASSVRLFYGGRSAVDLVLLERMARAGIAVDLATDDGSRGMHGRVPSAVERALDADRGATPPTLLVCGPEPMLIATARLARARALPAFLSLEGEMGCGIGVCLGCAVACATRPFRYTCKEGPVMALDELRGPYAPSAPAGDAA
ncbi:MAG: hypothetical protein EXR73_10220 [Myxococcales bacterium]|nr:hypothetical protein [Myxococcales bacterium]